ncbi:MAG: peptide chain release factor-like protein [bacterium]|nr:peptide chain release factor-like protein [bacterium]
MTERELIPPHLVRFQATRSGGPGGQRTNKRATKVHLWVPVDQLPLTETEHVLLRERLGHQITKQGELEVTCEEERFQVLNRETALSELERIVRKAITPPVPRVPTEPPRSVEERRHIEKEMRSERRKTRHRIYPE